MNKLESAAYVGAGLFLGLAIVSRVWEPPPKTPTLSTPRSTPDIGISGPKEGLSNEECVSRFNALGFYLLRGFEESTGFDWMRAKGVKADEIKVLSTCSNSFQGTVVEEEGINVRRIPYNNNAWLVGALTWGEEITFPHIVFVGKELWGVRGAGNDFEFFIIRGKNGAEFVRVKNLPEPPQDNTNFGQDQQDDLLHGRYPLAAQLKRQPPNPSMARAGGRVFSV